MTALSLALSLLLIGHESHPLRERGSAAVRRLVEADPGRWGPAVQRAAATDPSPEARHRAARVVPVYLRWLADRYTPAGVPVWPVMAGEYPVDWVEYLPPEERPPYWHGERGRTERHVRAMIRSGEWSPADADEYVARCWRVEGGLVEGSFPEHAGVRAGWKTWRGGYPGPPKD